jgi:3-deoxy-D-arabino-heptulosonate 7-phosphate (DAHP) synthase class II
VGKCGAVGRGRAGAAVMNNNVGMMSIRAVQAPPSRFDIGIYEESSTSSKKKKKVEEVKEKLKEMGEMQQKEQERRAEWSVSSWRSMMQLQQGEEEEEEEEEVVAVAEFPPLVFAGEAARLEERLAQAAAGRAFVLQAEDCSGHDRLCAHSIRDTFRVLLQMAAVLMFGGQMPVIKVNYYFLTTPNSSP